MTLGWLAAILVLGLPWTPLAGPLASTSLQPRLQAADTTLGRAGAERPFAGGAKAVALRQVEHLRRLGIAPWHAAGYLGQRLKIAVLDSGFRGYRAHLGKELPEHVLVRSFRRDGNLEARNSQHGVLCGEVLHALAPKAELLFANWDPDDPEEFLDAARWARQQGARIISCSVIMPSWSDGEGGGPFHEALARILGPGRQPGDVLLFASAGNTAQRHWSGTFRAGADRFHQWLPGRLDNELVPWSNERISVELCWRPGPRYRLLVVDATTGSPVGRPATRIGAERSCAVVRFQPEPRHRYQVRVQLLEGKPGSFHIVALGGDLAYATARGSIACPADGAAVVAVGAVGPDGRRAWYSSCGPNSTNPKPDLVAPVPFPSAWRPEPFTGTSAAAPQAAALAALWWSCRPGWSADQVRAALKTSAVDLGPPGHDFETGFGLVRMPDPAALSSGRPMQASLITPQS
jgi:hypothetical protein